MKLFRKLRARSRSRRSQVKKQPPTATIYSNSYKGPDLASRLPSNVLANIFGHVCPHTQDNSYNTCEESMTEDGCMLCDMRDLAHYVPVCKSWATEAQRALYRNVRLDAVHYCAREEELAEKRRRKSSLFDHNTETKDPTRVRLELFANTVKFQTYLGSLVETLKIPYMTRETCKADLARAVSALPNLRYVDLPEGLFSDDHSAVSLREELRQVCRDLRWMKYSTGSELSFMQLPDFVLWSNLEILELSSLSIEPEVLLYGLALFPSLREVKLQNIESLNDIVFSVDTQLPLFPPLPTLHISGHSHLTIAGLQTYLLRSEVASALTTLSLIETGLPVQDLHTLLAAATHLKTFTVRQTVSQSLTYSHTRIPPLPSQSLKTLHYEIIPTSNSSPSQSLTDSHYVYLSTSLLSSHLPSLTSLYAYSTHLPTLLLSFDDKSTPNLASLSLNPRASLLPPPSRSRASIIPSLTSWESEGATLPATSALTGLKAPLNLYTKPASAPETEWSLTSIHPPSEKEGKKGSISATRPLSMIAAYPSPRTVEVPRNFSLPSSSREADANGFLSVPRQGSEDRGREKRRRSGMAFAEVVGHLKRWSFSSAGSGSGSGDREGKGRGSKGGEWMGSE